MPSGSNPARAQSILTCSPPGHHGHHTMGTHTVLPQAPPAPRGCPGRTFTCNI